MSFLDKPHNWNEILVKDISRGEIKKHYEKYTSKIFPYLKDKDVLVILGVGKNQFVLKRNLKDRPIHITKKKGIDDLSSFEYWINRRVIEFHPIIGKRTDHIWVDIDLHNGEELNHKASELALDIEKYFRKRFGAKVKIYSSGRIGLHIEGYLKYKIDTNKARKEIREFLKSLEDKQVTTGIAKPGQIRLDVTTLKNKGSIRSPWSFSTLGKVKKPL